MEDQTKINSSGGGSKGDENKTAIKGNTTGDARSGDFVAGTVLAGRYRIIGLIGKGGLYGNVIRTGFILIQRRKGSTSWSRH